MGAENFDKNIENKEENDRGTAVEGQENESEEIAKEGLEQEESFSKVNQEFSKKDREQKDEENIQEIREDIKQEEKETSVESKENNFEELKEELRNKMLDKFNSKLDEMLSSEEYTGNNKQKGALGIKKSLESITNAVKKGSGKKINNFVRVLHVIQRNKPKYLTKELLKEQDIKNLLFKSQSKAQRQALEKIAQEFVQELNEEISEEDLKDFIKNESYKAEKIRAKQTPGGLSAALRT